MNYDEQLGITFTQNFTSLHYNVTAVEQTDPTLGTGPGYLLNGLSSTGYWYQVGVSWDWSPGAGFAMSYEVFNPLGNSIYPMNGGGGLAGFSGAVNPGDIVTLSLTFSSAGDVIMTATDVNTSATASQVYTAAGATTFVGEPSGDANANGFFTGLMTEWYHGQPYYANEAPVTYSTNVSISSAWMWMDEFNANNDQPVFAANASSVTTFTTQPSQLQEYSYSGVTEYANASEFVTGGATGSTTSTTATSTASSIPVSTDTVTTTIPTTVTATTTATATTTSTSTSTVTTTSTTTVTTPTTTTLTSSSTTTQTVTSTTTQPVSLSSLPVWLYALMFALVMIGGVLGYLLRGSPPPKPNNSSE